MNNLNETIDDQILNKVEWKSYKEVNNKVTKKTLNKINNMFTQEGFIENTQVADQIKKINNK